ncbi:chromate efflux transporter [Rhodanobacter sp. T12-5]|uniref:chromate efflux transporter n=1 Tax=Rhodanobacter sp. T12-5 TaxID=2024611 RepID=UPI0011F0205C|nr:chromate efflux transporter [Rhodanobacter sp. T12-5]KAA0068503.1 chromate efflux transporter [Rhodanobacter sp. T12-5]
MNDQAHAPSDQTLSVSLREATRVWAKIGLLSFGGPAGQIALMHRELVDKRRWISDARFLHALNYCMLLPGPEATQLAIYIAWLMHRTVGGLIAGVLFVLPGFVTILALSIVYALYGQVPLVLAVFVGLKAAVLAVVVEAVIRIGSKALKNRTMVLIALAAFVAIFFFHVPFPLIVLGAGLWGLLGRWWAPASFPAPASAAADASSDFQIDRLLGQGGLTHTQPSALRAIRVTLIWLVIWWTPVLAVMALWGRHSVLVKEGLFFSQTAVVTFGGAYAVLAYIAQRAVATFHWITPGQMLDGLSLAETTPGPLIMVVQFVAFLGAYYHQTGMSAMVAGIAGSVLTTWVTFAPCFLWIFLGAPYIEALRSNRALHAALSAVTAAVVGVVLNLSVWFTLHTVFARVNERPWGWAHLEVPAWATLQWPSAVIAVAAMLAMLRFKVGMGRVLLVSGLAGMAIEWFGIAAPM